MRNRHVRRYRGHGGRHVERCLPCRTRHGQVSARLRPFTNHQMFGLKASTRCHRRGGRRLRGAERGYIVRVSQVIGPEVPSHIYVSRSQLRLHRSLIFDVTVHRPHLGPSQDAYWSERNFRVPGRREYDGGVDAIHVRQRLELPADYHVRAGILQGVGGAVGFPFLRDLTDFLGQSNYRRRLHLLRYVRLTNWIAKIKETIRVCCHGERVNERALLRRQGGGSRASDKDRRRAGRMSQIFAGPRCLALYG